MDVHGDNLTAAIRVVSGREKSLGEDVERHVAILRVTLETDAAPRYREGDLLCVAERALYEAASAYNLATTRIVDVALVSIEEAESNG